MELRGLTGQPWVLCEAISTLPGFYSAVSGKPGECFKQSRCAGSHTAVPAVRVESKVPRLKEG